MKIAFVVAQDFNLGVGYILAYLKQRGDEVKLFFDPCQYNRAYAQNSRLARWLSVEDYNVRQIKIFNPKIVGISCITATLPWALHMARLIKDAIPQVKIVLGGVHPTLCPEDIPKEFDVCVGDGIKYFGGEFNPDEIWCEREMFLRELPPIHRQVQMFMTSFGCPFRCSFCNNHQLHRKLIKRNPDSCIGELLYWKNRGLKYVLFEDDVFTINKKWLKEFLSKYSLLICLPFTCFGHPKFLDEETVKLLKDSGCHMIWLGVQTANPYLRKYILNRDETNVEIRNACKLIKKHGLKLMIDHIFGIPEEDESDICFSRDFYKELKPDVVNCYELLYFPKAEINKHGKSKGQYQLQGGEHYKKYAKAFVSIPLGIS